MIDKFFKTQSFNFFFFLNVTLVNFCRSGYKTVATNNFKTMTTLYNRPVSNLILTITIAADIIILAQTLISLRVCLRFAYFAETENFLPKVL